MRPLALALAALVGSSGCATMVRGTTQPVSFTSVPEAAEVRDLASGRSWRTPSVVELERRHRYELVVTKEGYREERVYLRSEVPFKWWFIDAFTLGIGTLVDALTGGLYDLEPADVHVVLEREKQATSAPP